MNDKILIIKHGSLGDMVSATSVFKSIRNHFYHNKIYLLTTKMYELLFNKSDFFNEIIIYKKTKPLNLIKYFNFINFLKKKNFKLIIDLQNSQRTMIYCLSLRLISNTNWNGTKFGSTIRYKYDTSNPPHILRGLSEQISLLGIADYEKPNLDWLSCNISNLNITKPYFIVNPGCSAKHNYKKWPAKNFAEVAKYLVSKKITPVVIGTENDQESVKEIVLICKEAINLINNSPVGVIVSLSKNAIGALSNDTGPAHVIASTNCKLHLVLSNFTKVNQVAPKNVNVTYTQSNKIVDIKFEDIIKEINKMIGL